MTISSLNADIRELNSLLLQYGEKHWKLKSVSGGQSVRDLLRNFGGMGSLNDLYICEANGHKIAASEEAEVNQKVRSLMSSIHEKCALVISK